MAGGLTAHPQGALVERRGQIEQAVAQQIKEKPRDKQAHAAAHEITQPYPTHFFARGWTCQLGQAGGTEDAIIMLGDAFAAVAVAAGRASRHRLAFDVVIAPDLGE
jgi:hypothetical protein